jgi:hypothetical protein
MQAATAHWRYTGQPGKHQEGNHLVCSPTCMQVHLEAARMLQFHEAEFVRMLEQA